MARTGRPRSFDRERALDAAMHAFWQHGYEGASIDVLRQAMGGISSASFYAAYRSKEALYREALDRYAASYGQVVSPLYDQALAPRERIERALRASARMQTDAAHPLGCMVVLSARVCSPQNETLLDVTAQVRQANRRAISEAVDTAARDGALRPEAGNGGLAGLIDIALAGLSLAARDGVSAETTDLAVDAAMAAWDSYAVAA